MFDEIAGLAARAEGAGPLSRSPAEARRGAVSAMSLRARVAGVVMPTTRRLFRGTRADFDHVHGVDTEDIVDEDALGIAHDPDGSESYQATSLRHFAFAVSHVPRPLADWSFVDIGCGKGRIVLLAMGLPFRRVVGVEMFAPLLDVAEANLRAYRGSRVAGAVELSRFDARLVAWPDGDLVVYFYNPFRGRMLEQFLDHIEDAVSEQLRRLLLVYSNPVERFRLDRRPAFHVLYEGASPHDYIWWGNRWLVTYALGDWVDGRLA